MCEIYLNLDYIHTYMTIYHILGGLGCNHMYLELLKKHQNDLPRCSRHAEDADVVVHSKKHNPEGLFSVFKEKQNAKQIYVYIYDYICKEQTREPTQEDEDGLQLMTRAVYQLLDHLVSVFPWMLMVCMGSSQSNFTGEVNERS